jgi:pantothenate kinase
MPVTDCDEPELIFHAPGFDHAVGDPVPEAIAISSRCKVVIIEGNYTLLNNKPWRKIAQIVDER